MRVLEIIFNDENSLENSSDYESLQDRIESIRKRILDISNQIVIVKSNFPFTIADKLENEIWIAEQVKDILKEKENCLQSIADYKIYYNGLIGGGLN